MYTVKEIDAKTANNMVKRYHYSGKVVSNSCLHLGLFDENNNLIAIAKTDRHISKNVNEFLALGIKITL